MNSTWAAGGGKSQESANKQTMDRQEPSAVDVAEELSSTASALPPPAAAANTPNETTTTTTTMTTTTATATAATATTATTAAATATQAQIKDDESYIPQIAKDRLSKWAARLFDPHRPKGVMQPPQTIPLNDEFLQAFGKREQEMDMIIGNSITIDRTIPDDDDTDDEPNKNRAMAAVVTETKPIPVDTNLPNEKTSGSRNLKISNLRFATTQSELESLCKRFGDIEKTTLIKNPADDTKNLGIAYVLFVSSTAAARCMAELKNVQNRPVTVTEARPPESGNNSNTAKRKSSRYWQTTEDLSVKCFHCGLYGHMATACQNAKQLKPCTLCGFTSHDARNCDKKVFCYQCGLPGHASRDCTEKPIRRLICTICYEPDHHRSQCRNYRGGEPYDVQNAVCMTCGKLGHFSCQRVSVFFGLRGLSCCNCGDFGHSIQNCRSPNLAMCDRNLPMLDVGWTAAQVQDAVVQMNLAKRPNNDGRDRQQHQYNDEPKKRRML